MIRPFLVGFATTFRHMFKKKVTVNYPEQKVPMFPKYRGKQVLMRDENGLEKCVACGLCSVACPADAIYLEAAENDGTVMAGPRYAKVYQIHKTRCIFCGYCEEACPVSAIFMGKDYELAVYSKDDFIWDKADLLVPRRRREAAGHAAIVGRPSRSKPSPTSESHADRRRRRYPRKLRRADAAPWSGIRTCRSGSASATSPAARAPIPTPPAPLYWIKGNNEDFDRIAAWEAGARAAPNLHFIPNGTARARRAADASPASAARSRRRGSRRRPRSCRTRPKDDKRRHFVREEVEACKRLRGVDILMTHEARAAVHRRADEARPARRAARRDAGKPAINDVLATLKPRLHLCGHHHRFVETVREGVRVGLSSIGSTARTC